MPAPRDGKVGAVLLGTVLDDEGGLFEGTVGGVALVGGG